MNILLLIVALYIYLNVMEKYLEHVAFVKWKEVPYLDKNAHYYLYHMISGVAMFLLVVLLAMIQ